MNNRIFISIGIVALIGVTYWGWNTLNKNSTLDVNSSAQEVVGNVVETDAETGATIDMTTELESKFPGAPDTVITVAQAIISGASPTPEHLEALTNEDLNRAYSLALPDVQPAYGHTLLRQAVQSRNFEAAKALIAADANARFNDDEMAFMAVKMVEDKPRVWWSDYALGTQFLTLWLDAGGDPNAVNLYYDPTSTLLTATPGDNLEAVLVLLEAGADPWFKMPAHDDTSDDPYLYRSFFEAIANASSQSTEMSFRVVLAGYYRGGTQEQRDDLLQMYERIAADLKYARGPEALNTLWHIKMALGEVLRALDIQPSRDIADMMTVEVPDDIGGFWLGPDMLRSPTDGSHEVTTDNQFGTEMWRDR